MKYSKEKMSELGPGQVFRGILNVWGIENFLAFSLFMFVTYMCMHMIDENTWRPAAYVVILMAIAALITTAFFAALLWLIFSLAGASGSIVTLYEDGIKVQDAYCFSHILAWEEIIEVKEVHLPLFRQFLYLKATDKIIYCLCKHYQEEARFLQSLQRLAPTNHPLMIFFNQRGNRQPQLNTSQ